MIMGSVTTSYSPT